MFITYQVCTERLDSDPAEVTLGYGEKYQL